VIIRLARDYSAPLPLWGEGFGNIDWRYAKFPPTLLDRLAWQQEFDDNYHYETGWRSAPARDPWADHAKGLAMSWWSGTGSNCRPSAFQKDCRVHTRPHRSV